MTDTCECRAPAPAAVAAREERVEKLAGGSASGGESRDEKLKKIEAHVESDPFIEFPEWCARRLQRVLCWCYGVWGIVAWRFL